MLPVCDGQRLVGAITDRDLAIRAIAEGHDPLKTKVRDVMTPGFVGVSRTRAWKKSRALWNRKRFGASLWWIGTSGW